MKATGYIFLILDFLILFPLVLFLRVANTFNSIYESMGYSIPKVTRIVIGPIGFSINLGVILLAVLLIFLGFKLKNQKLFIFLFFILITYFLSVLGPFVIALFLPIK